MRKLIVNVYMPDDEAESAFEQMEARAINALVRAAGTESQSNSYSRLEDENGNLIDQWTVDDFGMVRSGEPDFNDPPNWVPVTGSHDSYPVTRLDGEHVKVMHNGQLWVNTYTSGVNQWEPGVFGWELV